MSKALTVDTAGITFSYREFGAPDGLPVLMLHGFPDAANAWDALVDALKPAKRNLRLLVPSMRGYGETLIRQENLLTGQEAALAQDVLAFADALKLERFLIVGHDWGARAGADACVLAPERVLGLLALSSPYVMYGGKDFPPEQVERYWYQWFFQTAQGEKALRTRAADLCEHIWHVWSPTWKFSRREFEHTAAYWTNPQFATVVLGSYRQRYGNELGKPAYQALQDEIDTRPKISVPTLFAYGTDDHCVLPAASEDLKRWFTGWFERVPIKGAGHFPHREQTAAVAKLFQRLLKKVQP